MWPMSLVKAVSASVKLSASGLSKKQFYEPRTNNSKQLKHRLISAFIVRLAPGTRRGHKVFSKFKVQGQVAIFYSRQEPSTLQPKKYKLKQESLASRKFKQEFYVSIKLKQAKRVSSDSSNEQKPKIFRVLILLLAGYKIENIVTLNYLRNG